MKGQVKFGKAGAKFKKTPEPRFFSKKQTETSYDNGNNSLPMFGRVVTSYDPNQQLPVVF